MERSVVSSLTLFKFIGQVDSFVMTCVRVLNVFVGQGLLGRLCLVEAGFRASDLMGDF